MAVTHFHGTRIGRRVTIIAVDFRPATGLTVIAVTVGVDAVRQAGSDRCEWNERKNKQPEYPLETVSHHVPPGA